MRRLLRYYSLALASAVAPAQVPAPPAADPFLAELRRLALEYSSRLPDFICTQVTRRSFSRTGNGPWRNLDETTQQLTFYDGQEHYHHLHTRKLANAIDPFQPWMNSTGEFGSLLRQIFAPESSARFLRVGADHLRGRPVQTFSYEVDFKHSKYEILWREAGVPMRVVDAYQGLLYVDTGRLAVLRLILESQPLPPPFPIRQVGLTLDYDDAIVAGKAYNLPLSFTMVVHMQKGDRIRNQVTFSGFQRFLADSRVITDRVK